MDNLKTLLNDFLNDKLYQIIISNPRNKGEVSKIKIRPIMQKEILSFQESKFVGPKVFHANYDAIEMIEEISNQLKDHFTQLELTSASATITALVSKKGKVTIKKKVHKEEIETKIDLSHNRKKKYILEEGIVVPFLVDLGIQTKEGKIVQSKYDKFKQINRYLEFVEDVLPTLKSEEPITIIDFGCGKAYLTFAMYYYFTNILKWNVNMIGLDLKEDVIKTCTAYKEQYGYDGLTFLQGDINDFEGTNHVDMVVTLHACDVATDYALQKAINWNAKVILSVPCCQHEVNKQISNHLLEPVLRYGIIKDRMSALITDAIRADMLEAKGYEAQILEFIDIENTPKNLLIRAVKQGIKMQGKKAKSPGVDQLEELVDALHIKPTIIELLGEKQINIERNS